MKIAIIDGDSIGYAIGWVKQDVDPDNMMSVITSVDEYMNKIMVSTKATHLLGFLGGVQPVFRQFASNLGDVFNLSMKGYKDNRGSGKPEWYYKTFYLITHRLTTKYGFQHVEFIEADDAVIIMANHYRKRMVDTVICHTDKDLNQYPGEHYNYQKDETKIITPDEAELNFWSQMITGDSTDNIEGIPGMGPKKATDALQAQSPVKYKRIVLDLYQQKFGEREGVLKFALTYNYLHILKEPAYQFDPGSTALVPVEGLLDTRVVSEDINTDEIFGNTKEENNE